MCINTDPSHCLGPENNLKLYHDRGSAALLVTGDISRCIKVKDTISFTFFIVYLSHFHNIYSKLPLL